MTDFSDLSDILRGAESIDDASIQIADRFGVTYDQALALVATPGIGKVLLPFLSPGMFGADGIFMREQ